MWEVKEELVGTEETEIVSPRGAGERMMLRSMLEDGLRLVMNALSSPYHKRRRLADEALTWIFDTECIDAPFSFVMVCVQLKLDPDYVRWLLLDGLAGKEAVDVPKQTHNVLGGKKQILTLLQQRQEALQQLVAATREVVAVTQETMVQTLLAQALENYDKSLTLLPRKLRQK